MHKSLLVDYIDDETDLLEIFREIVESDQVKVRTFENTEQLQSSWEAEKPDLVFIDYHIKNISGDELAQTMPDSIVKYLITGTNHKDLKSQFAGIIKKPIDFENVTSIIGSQLLKNNNHTRTEHILEDLGAAKHEINNALAIVIGKTHSLNKNLSNEEEKNKIERIIKATDRIQEALKTIDLCREKLK